MKKLAFFILLSLVTLGVSAQSNLKWNVNAGIGMSNWYGDDTDGTDAKFAYKVGIGLEDRLSGNFWLVSFKISYLCLPLFYETRTTPSCHPSGCAYRQL